MRKPRDIDAELKALAEKSRNLKALKITQLGELVTATGADALEAEVLAGVLLSAMESAEAGTREVWRRKGADFFRGGSRSRST